MKKLLLPLIAFVFSLNAFAQSENTSLNESISHQTELSVYPNPTKDVVIVNNVVKLGIKEIGLFNLLGDKVKITMVSGLRNSIKIDLSNLQPGIYFMKAYNTNGESTNSTKINRI